MIQLENIEPEVISTVFPEQSGHSTLGEEMGVEVQVPYGLPELSTAAALPVGTKVFVKSAERALHDDPSADAVGMIVGHQGDAAQLITLLPKQGLRWQVHNAYGEPTSEIYDAMAALNRLFDPQREFGSIAVLSEATGQLLGRPTEVTVGAAGCNSHEPDNLQTTLSLSQLLDTYQWKPVQLRHDSALFRRDEWGRIVHQTSDATNDALPSTEMRDRRSVMDRIERLTGPQSYLDGYSSVDVLRGIEHAVSSGVFTDRSTPMSAVSQLIIKGTTRIVK